MPVKQSAAWRRAYARLNPAQRRAVDAIEGTVMVLAGPGTGKTQVLAMRAANILLQTQLGPDNILCLTFTESGVAAMRQRLAALIGPTAYQVHIHTFHSFCRLVMAEHPDQFAQAATSEVLSDGERIEIFREIVTSLPATSPLKPFGSPYLYVPDLSRHVQSLKQEDITPAAFNTIIREQSRLVRRLKPALTPFLAKPARATSLADCRRFIKQLPSPKKDGSQAAAQVIRLHNFAAEFQRASSGATGKRGVQQVITQFRHSLRRWWLEVERPLPKQRELQRVYEAYARKLTRRGRLDFEDMILWVVRALRRDGELRAIYQEQFQYILLDEYQDTNSAQNAIVYELGAFHDNPNIFVVGDDQQSIYRFQGASLANLLSFYERYRRHVTVIALRDNYRSQPTILHAAHAVIAHNRASLARYLPDVVPRLRARAPLPPRNITVLAAPTVRHECAAVVQRIKQLLRRGTAPSEIAILYRRNADAATFAEQLSAQNIPHQVDTGQSVLADERVKQLIMLLEYLQQATRTDLLWILLNLDFFAIPPLALLQAQLYAQRHRYPFEAVLNNALLKKAGVTEVNAAKLIKVWQYLPRWQAAVTTQPLPVALSTLINESGLLTYLTRDAASLTSLLNVNAFFAEAKRLAERQSDTTLTSWLKYLELFREHNLPWPLSVESNPHGVRLLTAHKAKGLEFAHVFIVRATDHHWGNPRPHRYLPLPHGLLANDPVAGDEHNEDERRLWYVAMTRSKRQLYISYARATQQGREQVPSLFLEEIPSRFKTTEPEYENRDRISSLPVTSAIASRQFTTRSPLQDHIRERLTHYVMSVTHLNNYLTCPRLWYYRHLLRVPTVKNKAMAFGTAIHGALYDFYRVQLPSAERPKLPMLLTAFTKHLDRELLSPADADSSRTLGRRMLTAYYRRYADSSSRDNMLEYSFASHSVQVAGLPLTGYIDKIEIMDRAKEVANVVDYKTGNPDTKSAALRLNGDYHRQLVFYKLLADRSPRFRYTVATGTIDFVTPSPSRRTFVRKKYELTAADTKALTATIERVWQEIKHLDFLDPANPKFCGQCQYCLLAQTANSAGV